MKRLLAQLKDLEATSPSDGNKLNYAPQEAAEAPDSAFDELRDTTMKLMSLMPSKDQRTGGTEDAASQRLADHDLSHGAEEALKDQLRNLAQAK